MVLKEPAGELRKQIEDQFENLETFKKNSREAGATLFGSGWVWLSADDKGTLFITQGGNASNPMTQDSSLY